MLLPPFFDSVESEYEHLKKHVQLWDVTVQRQIEVNGKDSYKLIQLMTCRDLSKAKINRCYYVPLIDKEGNMVNDPLILKLKITNGVFALQTPTYYFLQKESLVRLI